MLGVLAAGLQLALPPAAAVADAIAQRESVGAERVHIESHSSAKCHRVHADDCVLCQTLAHTATPGRASTPLIARTLSVSVAAPDLVARYVSETWGQSPPSRAPPA